MPGPTPSAFCEIGPASGACEAKPYIPSALLKDVGAVLGIGEPITVAAAGLAERISAPVLPSAIKIDQPHTGIGLAGGLAEPVQEPET